MYGAMVEDLSTKGFLGTYWLILIQVRWLITIAILVFSRDYNFIQLMSLLFISGTFQVLIILGKPMHSSLENGMALFNEVMVSVYIYMLFILTDFFAETNLYREHCGWALILIMLSTISVNFFKFIAALI